MIFNNELVKNLEAAGIKTHSELYDPKTNDLRTEVSKAMDGSDTLVIGGFGPGVALAIKQASELGFNGNKVIGIAFTIQHLDKLEDLVEGAYYPTYPFTEYKSYPHFVASFKKKYGKDPDLFHPVPYGLIETLATAADKAGSDDAEKVATTLRETGKFEGAYETLSFNANQMAKVPLITSVYHRNGTSTPGE